MSSSCHAFYRNVFESVENKPDQKLYDRHCADDIRQGFSFESTKACRDGKCYTVSDLAKNIADPITRAQCEKLGADAAKADPSMHNYVGDVSPVYWGAGCHQITGSKWEVANGTYWNPGEIHGDDASLSCYITAAQLYGGADFNCLPKQTVTGKL